MILQKIIKQKKIVLEKNKAAITLNQLIESAEKSPRQIKDFYSSLRLNDRISIIAEVKKASPSKGLIRESFNHMEIAKAYLMSDVQAMSVLTEEDFFLGSPKYLQEISAVSSIPVIRKDFIIDKYQIYESYLLGADAILLILAILDDDTLKEFYDIATGLGLHCLCEVHDEEELSRAISLGARIVGINNRNLETFEEDISTTQRLIRHIPKETVTISESAIKTPEDLDFLYSIGADGVLIGEAFMRSQDIRCAVSEMRRQDYYDEN